MIPENDDKTRYDPEDGSVIAHRKMLNHPFKITREGIWTAYDLAEKGYSTTEVADAFDLSKNTLDRMLLDAFDDGMLGADKVLDRLELNARMAAHQNKEYQDEDDFEEFVPIWGQRLLDALRKSWVRHDGLMCDEHGSVIE